MKLRPPSKWTLDTWTNWGFLNTATLIGGGYFTGWYAGSTPGPHTGIWGTLYCTFALWAYYCIGATAKAYRRDVAALQVRRALQDIQDLTVAIYGAECGLCGHRLRSSPETDNET